MPALDEAFRAAGVEADRLRATIADLVDRCVWQPCDHAYPHLYHALLRAEARLGEPSADPRRGALHARFLRTASPRDRELRLDLGTAGDAYAPPPS